MDVDHVSPGVTSRSPSHRKVPTDHSTPLSSSYRDQSPLLARSSLRERYPHSHAEAISDVAIQILQGPSLCVKMSSFILSCNHMQHWLVWLRKVYFKISTSPCHKRTNEIHAKCIRLLTQRTGYKKVIVSASLHKICQIRNACNRSKDVWKIQFQISFKCALLELHPSPQ